MNDQIAVGACVLMVCLGLAFLILRRLVQPAAAAPARGRHRAPFFRPLRELVPVTGWCWAERRTTPQAPTDVVGQLVCSSCGHIIPGGGR
jgi:hypothetical protein